MAAKASSAARFGFVSPSIRVTKRLSTYSPPNIAVKLCGKLLHLRDRYSNFVNITQPSNFGQLSALATNTAGPNAPGGARVVQLLGRGSSSSGIHALVLRAGQKREPTGSHASGSSGPLARKRTKCMPLLRPSSSDGPARSSQTQFGITRSSAVIASLK